MIVKQKGNLEVIKLLKNMMVALVVALGVVSCSSTPNGSGYTQTGIASYYGDKYHGRKTANGETFNQNAKTAAHKKLPFGTKVRVTNLQNGKSLVVRINDRGPFVRGRIIDLSKKAFGKIGDIKSGLLQVKIEVVD